MIKQGCFYDAIPRFCTGVHVKDIAVAFVMFCCCFMGFDFEQVVGNRIFFKLQFGCIVDVITYTNICRMR